MRYALIAAALGLACAACASGSERTNNVARIATAGKTDWHIELSDHAGPVERFAAGELVKYVEKITGARLKIAASGKKTILLGLRKNLAANGLPQPKKGADGYALSVSSLRIIIAGDNPRGVLYGVYDLLERMGCRWYVPALDPKDPEVVPNNPNLSIPAGKWPEASPFEDRVYWMSGLAFEIRQKQALAQIDWAAKNRFNILSWQCVPEKIEHDLAEMDSKGIFAAMEKRGLVLHGPGHSFPYFLPTDRYFKDHPEWFGFRDGKRQPHGGVWPATNFCMSNRAAVEQFVSNVDEFVRKHPQIKRLDLLPIDGGLPCECEECSNSTPTDLALTVYNKVAELLAKLAPDVVVDCVPGYSVVEKPPEKVRPDDRLSACYAHWGRNHRTAYGDPDYPRKENLLAWMSLFKRFWICSYYAANSHQPFTGPPYLHAIAGDTEFMVKHHVTGALVLEFPPGFWWSNSFNVRMAGIYPYYYPARDPRSELHDYALHYYGPKAGPIIHEYLSKLGDNANLESSYRASRGDATAEDMAFLGKMQGLLKRASELARDNSTYAYRVGKLGVGMELMMHLGPGRGKVREAEQAVDACLAGKATAEDARSKIAEARAFDDAIIAHAKKLAESNADNGTMDADWVKGWAIGFGFEGPLAAAEKKL